MLELIPEDVKELCKDRAACGLWPLPVTAGEYLAWIADEAAVQRDSAEVFGEPEFLPYADRLDGIVTTLLEAGVVASKLPWEG